jgi:hypothetical protein
MARSRGTGAQLHHLGDLPGHAGRAVPASGVRHERARGDPEVESARPLLLRGTLGLYTGWSSVPVWLNLTTALVGRWAPSSPPAIAGQVAVLAGAVGTAVAIIVFHRGLLASAATVAWALSRGSSSAHSWRATPCLPRRLDSDWPPPC